MATDSLEVFIFSQFIINKNCVKSFDEVNEEFLADLIVLQQLVPLSHGVCARSPRDGFPVRLTFSC
jgi:hypothetical protein